MVVIFFSKRRHASYASSNRRLTMYRLASANMVNSRAVFFAKPR